MDPRLRCFLANHIYKLCNDNDIEMPHDFEFVIADLIEKVLQDYSQQEASILKDRLSCIKNICENVGV